MDYAGDPGAASGAMEGEDDDNCDEFEITGDCEQDEETMKFDSIVGALEEFIMDPSFQDAQAILNPETPNPEPDTLDPFTVRPSTLHSQPKKTR